VTGPQVIATAVYFGVPLAVIVRWVVVGRRFGMVMVWQMAVALALWLLQAGALAFAVLSCIGGHCNPPPISEPLLYALIGGAFLGILAMFVLSAMRHRLP
jgi:uncharacterized membrane-anchored protein YitT (DUF2179 family)